MSILIALDGPPMPKNLSLGFANNKGADHPAHPPSLISAFVIHLFESTICKLATIEISFFLASPFS